MTERPFCLHPEACPGSKYGTHCRPCANTAANRDPARRAQRSAQMLERYKDPVALAHHAERNRETYARLMQDPEFAERRRELGRKSGVVNLVGGRMPEATRKAGRTRTQKALAGIPEHRWQDYRNLLQRMRLTAPEAKAIIIADEAEQQRRAAAKAAIEEAQREHQAEQQRIRDAAIEQLAAQYRRRNGQLSERELLANIQRGLDATVSMERKRA